MTRRDAWNCLTRTKMANVMKPQDEPGLLRVADIPGDPGDRERPDGHSQPRDDEYVRVVQEPGDRKDHRHTADSAERPDRVHLPEPASLPALFRQVESHRGRQRHPAVDSDAPDQRADDQHRDAVNHAVGRDPQGHERERHGCQDRLRDPHGQGGYEDHQESRHLPDGFHDPELVRLQVQFLDREVVEGGEVGPPAE